MLVYYLVAGLVANVALVTNIIILLGVMCSIGTTLTLPGIAGVVLTVGMAVDANVLIYERIREELAKGKSLRGAIAAGYARAFGTIFDSHVTTLISSIILIFMGTGEIKGFGVTLTIGVAASLFTALVVTRLIFDFLLDRNWLKSLPMFHLIRATKLDFMKLAKPAVHHLLDVHRRRAAATAFHARRKAVRRGFPGRRQHHLQLRAKAGCGADPRRAGRRGRKGRANPVSKGRGRRARDAARDHGHRLGGQGRSRRWSEKFPQAQFKPIGQQQVGAVGRRGNPAVGHHRLAAVAVRHPGLCRVPLRILVRRRRRRRR